MKTFARIAFSVMAITLLGLIGIIGQAAQSGFIRRHFYHLVWGNSIEITVRSASYGANCGAPEGNVTTKVKDACDGRSECNYIVDVGVLGDVARGCGKNFFSSYTCGSDQRMRHTEISGEAGFRRIAHFYCDNGAVGTIEAGDRSKKDNSLAQESISTVASDQPGGATPLISIVEASYGLNCEDFPEPANAKKWTGIGNVSAVVKEICDGHQSCNFTVDPSKIGDPANACRKEFVVKYLCSMNPQETKDPSKVKVEFIPAAADGEIARLSCDRGISIVDASYGLNCGNFAEPADVQKWVAPGNVTTPVRHACEGREQCTFIVDVSKLGDPARYCAKDFSATYRCDRQKEAKAVNLPAAADGKALFLSCDKTPRLNGD
jgi:hypothetical protein